MAAQEVNSVWVPDFVDLLPFQGDKDHPFWNSECIACGSLLDMSYKVKEILVSECDSENPAATLDEFYEKHNLGRTSILLCGHILCHCCFKQHSMAQRRRLGVSHNCPVCRKVIACRACGRSTKPITVPPVQWPLNPESFNPFKAFREHVPFTAAERDLRMNGGACKPCLRYQILKNARAIAKALQRKCPFDDCEWAQCACQKDHKDFREKKLAEMYKEKIVDIAQQIYAVVDLQRDPEKAKRWKQERHKMHNDFIHTLTDGDMKDFKNSVWAVCLQDSQRLQLEAWHERQHFAFTKFLFAAANTSIEHMGSRWSEVEAEVADIEEDGSADSDDEGIDEYASQGEIDNVPGTHDEGHDAQQGSSVSDDDLLGTPIADLEVAPLDSPPAQYDLDDPMRTLITAVTTLLVAESRRLMPSSPVRELGDSFSLDMIREDQALAFASGIRSVLEDPEELESLIQRAMEAVVDERDYGIWRESEEAHEESENN